MGNVHPYPRYLSREPSLHGHPAPLKKYGLVSTHLGCKSAIKGTVHLLLCHAKMLIPGRFLQPTSPSPLPCCSPAVCHPTQGKIPFHRGNASPQANFAALFSHFSEPLEHGWDRAEPGFWLAELLPLPAQAVLPSHPHFPCPSLEVWFTPALRAIFTLDLQGYLFYVTLCD